MVDNEFTGLSAQDDPSFYNPDFSLIEDEISSLDSSELQNDPLLQSINYDNYILLSKKELSEFLRVIEPWSKVTTDSYGKCVRVTCPYKDQVLLQYANLPNQISTICINKSEKTVPEFFIQIELIKKILSESYTSVAFVYENNEMNIALLDKLLFIETLPLSSEIYTTPPIDSPLTSQVDIEKANYIFKKMSFMLNLADRVSEKVMIIRDDKVIVNTNAFVAEFDSPFSSPLQATLYKTVTDTLGLFTELAKTSIVTNFSRDMKMLHISVDGKLEAHLSIISDIEQFLSPRVDALLNFTPNITIQNDIILRLAQVATSFDYLNNTLSFNLQPDLLKVSIVSSDLTRKTDYDLQITSPSQITPSEIKLGSKLLKSCLEALGGISKYHLSPQGLGLSTDVGKVLICRQS